MSERASVAGILPGSAAPHETVLAALDAFGAGDWDAMRALYHPDAMLVTLASGGRLLGRDESLAAAQEARADRVYAFSGPRARSLDPAAVLVIARIRYRLPAGGFADGSRAWIFTFRDGLVWRQSNYADEDEALDAYARLGLDLGVPG